MEKKDDACQVFFNPCICLQMIHLQSKNTKISKYCQNSLLFSVGNNKIPIFSQRDAMFQTENILALFHIQMRLCLCLSQFQALTFTPRNPEANFKNLSNAGHPDKFFHQMPGPRTSLEPFILMKFALFHHLNDLSH